MAAAEDDKHYVCKSEQEALDSITAFAQRNYCSSLDVELTIRNPSQPRHVPEADWDGPNGNVHKRFALYSDIYNNFIHKVNLSALAQRRSNSLSLTTALHL
jgi:hypothetical protein